MVVVVHTARVVNKCVRCVDDEKLLIKINFMQNTFSFTFAQYDGDDEDGVCISLLVMNTHMMCIVCLAI